MATSTTQTTSGNEIIQSFGSCYKQLIGSDYLKALVTAFFTAFWGTLLLQLAPLFTGSAFPTLLQIKVVIIACIGSGLGALSRKYVTNSTGQMFKKDTPKVDNTTVKE